MDLTPSECWADCRDLTNKQKREMLERGGEERELVARSFIPMVYSHVNKLCSGNSIDRDEAEGEAMLGLAEALDSYQHLVSPDGSENSVGGWVWYCIRLRLLKFYRRNHQRWGDVIAQLPDDDLIGERDADQERLVANDLMDKAGLTQEERRVTELYALQDYRLRSEVGPELSITNKAARRAWDRAMAKLKRALNEID